MSKIEHPDRPLQNTLTANPLFFVEVDFGKIGRAFVECDRLKSSFEQVVDDIVTAQIEKPIRVLEVIEDERSCRDITEDVARAVRDRLVNEQIQPSWEQASFIHEQLGVNALPWALQAAE